MRVEPLYGLPVEQPGDREGSSVVAGAGDAVLAESIAAEIARLDAGIEAAETMLGMLPRRMLAGDVRLPREVFVSVSGGSFYGTSFLRGSEAITFAVPFDAPPAVVVIPNNTSQPGFSVECSASDITTSGFVARLAVSASFVGTFVSRWIAMETTQ